VEDPATTGPGDRDALVAAAVAVHRDEYDVVAERPHRSEPEPVVATVAVLDPRRSVRPLRRQVAAAFGQPRVLRRVELGGTHVHPRPREVREPTRVVEVEMGEHDVGDVVGVMPEGANLGDGGLGGREHRPGQGSPAGAEPPRVGQVLGAQPRVDEQQPVGPLHQQAVRHHAAEPDQPEARAVEVTDHPVIVSGQTSDACSFLTVLELLTVSGSG